MQRMSSGLKIISAKDDAAGTVISAKMNVQLGGNKIAQNNVQNGNAMLSTAEGNLDVVLDNVSRIRDLTLQAKNGTYSKEEIQAMQDEVSERIAEIDRVASSSMYSSLQLFGEKDAAGELTGLAKDGATFQVGANASSDNTITADKSLFAGVAFKDLTEIGWDDSYADTTTLSKTLKPADGFDGDAAYVEASDSATYACKTETISVAKDADTNEEKEVVTEVLCHDKTTGKVGYVKVDDYLTDAADADNAKYTLVKKDDALKAAFDLSSMDKAQMATSLETLDDAIDNITARKSIIGSAQNRLDSALDTLTTQYENLSSAKSIITDADIASEASTFTQQQILQQVSTSLLAQANQAPSVALSLV